MVKLDFGVMQEYLQGEIDTEERIRVMLAISRALGGTVFHSMEFEHALLLAYTPSQR
jgi:hypothetical protein